MFKSDGDPNCISYSRIPSTVPENIRRLCYHKELDGNLQKHLEDRIPFQKLPKFGIPTLQSTWVRLPRLLDLLGLPEMEYGQEEKQEEEMKHSGQEETSELKEEQIIRSEKDITNLLEQFKCLACPGQVSLFSTFSALENHFLSIHKVSDLLTGPATSAVLLPTTLATFACSLCSEGGWLEEPEVREHLGTRHGDFFRDGTDFYVVYCR